MENLDLLAKISKEDLKIFGKLGYECKGDTPFDALTLGIYWLGKKLTPKAKIDLSREQRKHFSADLRDLYEENKGKIVPEMLASWSPFAMVRIGKARAAQEKKVLEATPEDLRTDIGLTMDPQTYIICSDRRAKKRYVFNAATGVLNHSYISFKDTFLRSDKKEGGRDSRFKYAVTELIYDSEKPKLTRVDFGDGVIGYEVNSYIEPLWMQYKDVQPGIHPILEKWLRWIYFDNQPTIDRLYDFLARSMMNYDPQMFIMATSTKGVGKTAQYQIFEHLMPEGRTIKLNRDTLKGTFDGKLASISFGLIDEISLTDSASQEKIKQWISNKGYTPRAMYTEDNSSLKNVFTFMAATNVRRDLSLDVGERRFFIPNMREEPFGNFGTAEERKFITDLAEGANEQQLKEIIAPFGQMLRLRYKERNLAETPWEDFQRIKPLNFWLAVKEGWTEVHSLFFDFLRQRLDTKVPEARKTDYEQGVEFGTICMEFQAFCELNGVKKSITRPTIRKWLRNSTYRGTKFAEPLEIIESNTQRWRLLINSDTEFELGEYDCEEAERSLMGLGELDEDLL